MTCKVEGTTLIAEIDGKTYTFEAHGEKPCPSLLGWGLMAGGRYWSDRDPEKVLEKRTCVQDAALGNNMIAWYTQEFKPDGVDYKTTKNAKIYVGDLLTGEQRLVYKGECCGDLCFDGNDLYFNLGNKVAVIDLLSGEITVLFKHSGLKKNGVDLNIREKRIFFRHWTHNNNYIMWYDREKKEVVNPHIDTGKFYFLNETTIIYRSLDYAWIMDVETMKKKHFFSKKQISDAITKVCAYLELPLAEYCNDRMKLRLLNYDGKRVYFECISDYISQTPGISYEENQDEAFSNNLPRYILTEISSDKNGKDIRLEFTKENVVITSHESNGNKYKYLTLKAYSHEYK